MCEICSKLTINKPERRCERRFGVIIVNLEQILPIILVFSLLTLNGLNADWDRFYLLRCTCLNQLQYNI